ncbi:hypothetical protein AMECASPLE_036597 [Ameca splendens]|uniref:CARD domain-containing protein n=1 Tax=Ameca splendens TaxID=208324 RepID=A0ABV0Z7A4_9TELE
MDSVLEASPIRADKAQALIDMVKRKGPEASRKMIARLQKLDPTLYCELGLSSDQPAQPDIELFRHHGSLFIRRIAEVFEWCSHHDDISELFSKVSVVSIK